LGDALAPFSTNSATKSQKNAEKFGHIKKKQYFCTRFRRKASGFWIFFDENSRREMIVLKNKGGLGSLLYD